MDYSGATAFLDGLRDLERGDDFDPDPSNYLPRVRWMLDGLDNPEGQFRSVIVGGTNGKGTVASLLEHILLECGFHVGLYTSPHLLSIRERIRSGGESISRAGMIAGVDEIRRISSRDGAQPLGVPTKFEALTVMAAHFFAEENVDIGIFEVGLGGRFDATNAWDSSVAALTRIALDHTAILGETLRQIAADKIHIARPGGRLHTLTCQPPTVRRYLRREAERLGIDLVEADSRAADALFADGERTGPSGFRPRTYRDNAALALSLARDLANPELATSKLAEVIRRHRWPGRFELVKTDPPVILDGAHNPDAVERLVDDLSTLADKWSFVFGATQGHDAAGMLGHLSRVAKRIVVATTRHPRGVDAEELSRLADLPVPVSTTRDAGLAVGRLMATNDPVCVTGSLHLVGEVRASIGRADRFHVAGAPSRRREKPNGS